jgi:hypothetical protein
MTFTPPMISGRRGNGDGGRTHCLGLRQCDDRGSQESGASEPPPGIEFSAPNSAKGCAPVPETATASACATAPPPIKAGTTTVTATVGVVFALL